MHYGSIWKGWHMNHDEKIGGVIIYFMVIGIVANETGSPLLAIAALVAMPIAAMLVVHVHREKQKR